MKCPICGNELVGNVCADCGARIAPEPTMKNGVYNSGRPGATPKTGYTTYDPELSRKYCTAPSGLPRYQYGEKKERGRQGLPGRPFLLFFLSAFVCVFILGAVFLIGSMIQHNSNQEPAVTARPATSAFQIADTQTEAAAPLTVKNADPGLLQSERIEKALLDPDGHAGESLWLGGWVSDMEKENGASYFVVHVMVDGRDQEVMTLYDGEFNFKDNDYILLEGTVLGKHESSKGKNKYIVLFQASTVNESSYGEVMDPALQILEPDTVFYAQDSIGSAMLNRVEFAKEETRFLIHVENLSDEDLAFDSEQILVEQGGVEYRMFSWDRRSTALLSSLDESDLLAVCAKLDPGLPFTVTLTARSYGRPAASYRFNLQ